MPSSSVLTVKVIDVPAVPSPFYLSQVNGIEAEFQHFESLRQTLLPPFRCNVS
jgi:hypothetical protein